MAIRSDDARGTPASSAVEVIWSTSSERAPIASPDARVRNVATMADARDRELSRARRIAGRSAPGAIAASASAATATPSATPARTFIRGAV